MDCCCAFLRPIPDSQKRISIRDAEPAERDPKVTVEDVSPVRTGADARASIRLLKEGNTRFTSGNTLRKTTNDTMRKELEIAEAPHCAIIGCADSQVPLETIFDSSPGDIFALRNAGNTCTHAEGSMVGSLEFCISKLKSRLILVLGHTHCSAVYGATKAYFDTVQAAQAGPPDRSERASTALEGLLQDLSCIAEQAASEVGRDGRDGEFEEVAIHAVKINVFHTINFLLKYSSQIRQMVRRRQVEIQGGIYDLASGHVEFLGCSPDQEELLSSKMPLPLSVAARSSNNPLKGVRTASDSWMTAKQALEVLKEGNSRFVLGTPLAKAADDQMREALVNQGQAPHTAVLGCADSRVPVDIIFDAMPGDMFVLRNAGNTCPSPNQTQLLSSEHHLPPSMATLPMRKESDGPVPPRMSLKLLKEGNERFVNGNQSAKISNCERRALAEDGQAPHCAIIGCADSRAPLETIFDAMPGDIFALRNAGNTCTHTEGSMLGSLEFCTSTLGTRLILVLGHTQCSAIKGATKMFLQSGGVEPTENRALDALFAGLTTVVEQAASELGCYATEEAIVSRATKLNIYRSINFLLQYSEIIREQVDEGELEIQGGIYDLETGSVHFLGRSPFHAEVLKSESSPSDSSWTFEKVAGS